MNGIGRGRGRGRPPPTFQFGSDSSESTSSSPSSSDFDEDQSDEESSSSSPSNSGLTEARLSEARGEPDPIMNKARGQEGRQFNMSVNYIRVRVAPGNGIYAYEVKFEPNIESRKLRFEVLNKPECVDVIGNVMQFTGMNLYLPKLLPDGQATIRTTSHQNEPIDMTLKFIKEPPFGELVPFYNTLFRRIMQTLKMVEINRQFFNPASSVDIRQHNLAIWSGVTATVHDLDGGLLLNLDTSHKILRNQTALEILKQILMNPATKPANFKVIAEKMLVGCVVITKYNNRPYRIDGIDFQQNPESTFQYADGRQLSYVEYFAEHWEQIIKDTHQPLLIHRLKPRSGASAEKHRCEISLIPELCFMTGLTDDARSDCRAMKDIAEHTRIKPAIRQEKLLQFLDLVLTTPEARKQLTDWNIELERRPVKTTGRTLEPERILFGKNQQWTKKKAIDKADDKTGDKADDRIDWSREAGNSRLLVPIDLDKWLLVFTKRDAATAEEFVKTLKLISVKMGFTVKDPFRVDIDRDGPLEYTNAIKQFHRPGDQIVVVITPGYSQKEDRYNAIKRLCCCDDMSVPSQVVRADTLTNPKIHRRVCQKIAIQMNCKMGGQPWSIQNPWAKSGVTVMIVGIDVYHDPQGKSKSVVAVVASINNTITRWYTRVSFQNTLTELANCLRSAFLACMKKFHLTNNTLPQRVFVYRDGVSDQQLNVVRDYEVVQIENALSDYAKSFKDYKPTLSVVVVQKSSNTKMMKIEGRGRLVNPPPGSVLDHTVTKKNFYDFYLVSQFVNQGTAEPTHYIVVHDKNEMRPDRMQMLAYKLTHLYYNWMGAIQVPAPCQYAHKAAYLVGQNIRRTVSEELCDKLFYL